MKQTCDVLIIGAGLAGSIFAWQLQQAGCKVLLVTDPSIASASRAAAGLINPVTGQRLVLQENIEVLLASAHALYHRIEKAFGITLLHQRDMMRVLRNDKEHSAWQKRRKDVAYQPYIATELSSYQGHDAFLQYHTGFLDTNLLLNHLHAWFRDRGQLIESNIDYNDIVISTEGAQLHDLQAERIIFCEGWRGQHNPWFGHLPFQPAKGEILTLSTSSPLPDQIINFGKWLLPVNGSTFKFGATYAWDTFDEQPTQAAHSELMQSMAAIFPSGSEADTTAHVAGVRPGTKDKQPFLGMHAEHKNVGIFNGFGSKGSLLIPWHAEQFADHLMEQSPLPAQADIARFMARVSITGRVHQYLTEEIIPGDNVIDATLGNGHDALFLAHHVGPTGKLFGFDTQSAAIDSTTRLLTAHNQLQQTILMQKSHADMAAAIPEALHGQIKCIMFNLGYLPGSDKSITTCSESTIAALNQSCQLLTEGGVISLLAYTGHHGGSEEFEAVQAWTEQLSDMEFNSTIQNLLPDHTHPPQWVLIHKHNVTDSTSL